MQGRQRPTPADATLPALRALVERLTNPCGRFVVACSRCGVRPVPIEDCRFPDRASATVAATVASTYRARLRTYDERTATHDLAAVERPSRTAITKSEFRDA